MNFSGLGFERAIHLAELKDTEVMRWVVGGLEGIISMCNNPNGIEGRIPWGSLANIYPFTDGSFYSICVSVSSSAHMSCLFLRIYNSNLYNSIESNIQRKDRWSVIQVYQSKNVDAWDEVHSICTITVKNKGSLHLTTAGISICFQKYTTSCLWRY